MEPGMWFMVGDGGAVLVVGLDDLEGVSQF